MEKEEQLPRKESITRTPFAGSVKIYVPGKIHDIQVAMREVNVDDAAIKGPGGVWFCCDSLRYQWSV